MTAEHYPSPPAASRNRLRIGFRITRRRLQGTVEVDCRTGRIHTQTTILWCRRIDDFSRRVLADALRVWRPCPAGPHPCFRRCRPRPAAVHAADPDYLSQGPPSRRLLRTLPPSPAAARLHPRFRAPQRRIACRHWRPAQPHPPSTVRDRCARRRGRRFLEPGGVGRGGNDGLDRRFSRTGPAAPSPPFVLEIRAEFDDLAPRPMDHQVYTQRLIVTRVSAKTVCVELEACPGPAQGESKI